MGFLFESMSPLSGVYRAFGRDDMTSINAKGRSINQPLHTTALQKETMLKIRSINDFHVFGVSQVYLFDVAVSNSNLAMQSL